MTKSDYKKLLNSLPGDVITAAGISCTVTGHEVYPYTRNCLDCPYHTYSTRYASEACSGILDNKGIRDDTRVPLPCADLRYYDPESRSGYIVKDFIRVDDLLGGNDGIR